MATLSPRVRAEVQATGPRTIRAMLLGRSFGLGREQRKALNAGRPVVLQTEWLRSQYREHNHPSFPPDFGVADAWRLEADGQTLTPAP